MTRQPQEATPPKQISKQQEEEHEVLELYQYSHLSISSKLP